MSARNQIQSLIKEVKGQVQKAGNSLEKALQERENIISTPIPKQEVKDNFSKAVDMSAKKFENTLKNMVLARARKRDAIGVQRNPEAIRKQGQYNELNIEAINFFMGDIIKQKMDKFIDEMEYFSKNQGLSDDDYQKTLETVELKIDELKTEHTLIVNELDSILK